MCIRLIEVGNGLLAEILDDGSIRWWAARRTHKGKVKRWKFTSNENGVRGDYGNWTQRESQLIEDEDRKQRLLMTNAATQGKFRYGYDQDDPGFEDVVRAYEEL